MSVFTKMSKYNLVSTLMRQVAASCDSRLDLSGTRMKDQVLDFDLRASSHFLYTLYLRFGISNQGSTRKEQRTHVAVACLHIARILLQQT